MTEVELKEQVGTIDYPCETIVTVPYKDHTQKPFPDGLKT